MCSCCESSHDHELHLAAAGAGVVDVAADARAIWGLLMSSYMNLLLVAVPLGFAAQLLGWSAGLRFSLVRQVSASNRVQYHLHMADPRGGLRCSETLSAATHALYPCWQHSDFGVLRHDE